MHVDKSKYQSKKCIIEKAVELREGVKKMKIENGLYVTK